SMFTYVDRETGRMLALRADITPQIARVVATRLRDEPKPVRLAYVTNVFRHDEPQMSHYREFYQAGVELIGLEKPEAEVEVIAMTIEGLRALGLERFQIDLGHPDFFRGLLDEASTDGARRQALRDLGEVRGFDYYSGLYFEAYVSGFGAALAGGGRYDDMLGRFGYDCPAVGFAFDIARALAIMENQQIPVELPGPDFFIIDFTPEKTAAL